MRDFNSGKDLIIAFINFNPSNFVIFGQLFKNFEKMKKENKNYVKVSFSFIRWGSCRNIEISALIPSKSILCDLKFINKKE